MYRGTDPNMHLARDSLKTWLQNNDIKDKSALLENRKLIEVVSVIISTVGNDMNPNESLSLIANGTI